MKCKDCKDTMCKHRMADAEMECVYTKTISTSECIGVVETVENCGLRFEDGRLYMVEKRQKTNKCPYEVKTDVTEDVLDSFLKIIDNS